MTSATLGERLYRYNLLLADDDSNFLDRLVEEIREASGAKVSRSEIIRAAALNVPLATLVGACSENPPTKGAGRVRKQMRVA